MSINGAGITNATILDDGTVITANFVAKNTYVDSEGGGVVPGQAVPVPATLTSPGKPGQFASDANWLYICYATNLWKQAPLHNKPPLALGYILITDYPYNAVGGTDCTAATTLAVQSGAHTIEFPAGTFLYSGNGIVPWTAGNPSMVIKGAGKGQTILKSAAGIVNWLVQLTLPVTNLTFEDITFDTDGKGVGAVVGYGYNAPNVKFKRCEFLCKNTIGMSFVGPNGFDMDDCNFHGYATALSEGLAFSGGGNNINVRNNKFRYCNDQMIVDTGSTTNEIEDITEYLTIRDNDFDMGWWAWPTASFNSGSTVTYTGNTGATPPTGVLTDTAATFGTLPQFSLVRIMQTTRTSTIGTASATELTDSGASFSTVIRGSLVRTASAFTYVTGAASDTDLRIEGWLDTTTYLPVAPPSPGTAYTLFNLILGRVNSNTTTTITTLDGFFDLTGALTVPTNGTRYEIFHNPDYNLHVEYSAAEVRVVDNIFRRGWSDQCSIYCNRAQILGNTIEDGNDMGITLNGTSGVGMSLIENNHVRHNGTCGMFLGSCTNVSVIGNMLDEISWTNQTNLSTLSGILVQGAANLRIDGNTINGGNRPCARAGIAISGDTVTSSDITVSNNNCTGVSVAGIVIDHTLVSGIHLRDNRASIAYTNGAVGVDSGTLYAADLGLSGSPETHVVAAAGSQYISSTSQLYLKTSGTGATGWIDMRLLADGSNAGLLSTTTQAIAGAKTFSGAVVATPGTGTAAANVGGVINSNVTPVGNVGGGEDTLITYTLPANSLTTTGRGIRVKLWGHSTNTANAKTVKLYFGTTAILSASLTINVGDQWFAEMVVIRTGLSAQSYFAQLTEPGTVNVLTAAHGTITETETGTLVVKSTGTATTDNDIVCDGMITEYI